MTISNQFGSVHILEDPEELWDTFKRETKLARNALGSTQGHEVALPWWRNWKVLRRDALPDLLGTVTFLSRTTTALLRRDKERYVGVLLRMSSGI